MKHENRQRLEANQKAALSMASMVIEGNMDLKNKVRPDKIVGIAKEDFSVESLTELAHKLNIVRDAARNIDHYETVGEDGTSHVIRDARDYKTKLTDRELNTDKNSIYMQIISSTRAAKHMLDHYKPKDKLAHERLHKLFSLQFAEYDKLKTEDLIPSLKAYNGMLLDLLRKSGIDKVDDMKLERALDTTQQAMNFLDKNCHFTTITQVNEVAVVESDIAMLGVTEEQKEQLIDISNSDARTKIGVEWYDTLSLYNKHLAKFCARQMLNEQGEIVKKVPTQLRYLMPFGKNMYTKFTYAHKEEEGMTMVSENAHSGAIFYGREYGDGRDRDEQVKQMAAQIQTFAPTMDTKVNQIVTASPNNIFSPADKEVERQTQMAMNSTGNTSSTTALNLFRKFTSGHKEGYKQMLDQLADVIRADGIMKGDTESVHLMHYLKAGEGHDAAKKYLENAFKAEGADKAKLKALYVALQARELLDNKWPFIEAFGNNNLKLYEYFSALNFAIHNEAGAIRQGFPGHTKELNKIPYLALNCMSGTNRTGVAMCVASVIALEQFVDGKPDVLEPKSSGEVSSQILQAVNKGGHTQEYTAVNALGAHGVKMASKNSETYPLFSMANVSLTLNSARANLSYVACNISLKVLDGIKEIKAGLLGAIKIEELGEGFTARLMKSVSTFSQNVR